MGGEPDGRAAAGRWADGQRAAAPPSPPPEEIRGVCVCGVGGADRGCGPPPTDGPKGWATECQERCVFVGRVFVTSATAAFSVDALSNEACTHNTPRQHPPTTPPDDGVIVQRLESCFGGNTLLEHLFAT